MAKSNVLTFLLGLAVASFCVANAGRIPAEQGRQLIDAGGVGGVPIIQSLVVVLNLVGVSETVAPGTATLQETVMGAGEGDKPVVAPLVPGKVTELQAVNVLLQEPGIVHLVLEILGVEKVIALDLVKLKATLMDSEVRVVVVFVLDEVNKLLLHLRDGAGKCVVDLAGLVAGFVGGQLGGNRP